ncbi:hypothetical protein LEMLEM_LOCUS16474, partial [Lemmus lemmus]
GHSHTRHLEDSLRDHEDIGLESRLSSEERLLFFHGTQVWFPAPTHSNRSSSSRDSDALFRPLQVLHTLGTHR